MKKILSIMICLLLTVGLVPCGVYADSVDGAISQRIDSLYSLLGNTYWNDNHDTSCGAKSFQHSCGHCKTTNIVKAQWFKDLFGSVSEYQFANSYADGNNDGRVGWSCAGFARFAEWYIFKSSNSDTITTDLIGIYNFNYNEIASHAKIGDILRLDNKHSVIFISADSSGIYIMDGNWSGSYNCLITKHSISYDYASTFAISRAQNRDSIAPSAPSNLANIPNGIYSIQHNNSGLYLSAGSNNEDGFDTILYEFGNNGDFGLDQKFYLERLSNNAYKIISQYDNRVIEVESLSLNDEAHIQKWSYNGVASQQWYIVDRGDGYYKFINVNSGKALDVGGYLQQWSDNNTDAQKFKIEAAENTMSADVPNGIYAIQFKKNGLYLSAGSNDENGFDTILYEPGNNGLLGEDQKFYFERLPNNSYKLISQYNNKVLEVDNLSYYNLAHIQQWGYNNVATQNWVIINCGNGYYNFINKHSGKAIDIGDYVYQWEYNNTDAQKFKIIPINYTINYDANGGSGAPSSQSKTYLEDLLLNSNIPTKSGYIFRGWNTKTNGEGASYNAGDKYTLDSDVTLYAQWEKETITPSPTPTVEPTPSPIQTTTPSPTPTEKPTSTPSPSAPPTSSHTPMPTATPTPMPTATPTPMPTTTPTPMPATDGAKVKLSSVTALAGKTVNVTVDISDNKGFANLGLQVGYDASVFTLTSVDNNSSVGATYTAAQNITANPYNMVWDSTSNVSYNGTLATLTFKVNDNAADGTYPITVSYYKGIGGNYTDGEDVNYDADFKPLVLNYVNGAITVSSHIPGDINGDGKVNNQDGTFLLRHLAGWNVSVDESALDVNGDSKINNQDGTVLLRYLAGWSVTIH